MITQQERAFALARKLGVKIEVSDDCLEVQAPPGQLWDFTDTGSIITSRETGESDESMWSDLVMQLKFGLRPEVS